MNDNGKITVLYIKPRKKPEIIEIDDTLEAMQELVGGNIEEYMPFEEDDVALICNEEGKINGMELNRALYDSESNIKDIIAGDFFLCHAPLESESFLSMPDDLLKKYEARFQFPEAFIDRRSSPSSVPLKFKSEDLER